MYVFVSYFWVVFYLVLSVYLLFKFHRVIVLPSPDGKGMAFAERWYFGPVLSALSFAWILGAVFIGEDLSISSPWLHLIGSTLFSLLVGPVYWVVFWYCIIEEWISYVTFWVYRVTYGADEARFTLRDGHWGVEMEMLWAPDSSKLYIVNYHDIFTRKYVIDLATWNPKWNGKLFYLPPGDENRLLKAETGKRTDRYHRFTPED